MPKLSWPQAVALCAAALVAHRVVPATLDLVGYLVERRDERLPQLSATVH